MAEKPKLPPNPLRYLVFREFSTMDTSGDRIGLDPKKMWWLENIQPVALNKGLAVPGPGSSVTSGIDAAIKSIFFAVVQNTGYFMIFTINGELWYSPVAATTAATKIANAGTFTAPDVTYWQGQVALIADPTAGYVAWTGPGGTLVKQGGVSPSFTITAPGQGYINGGTVTISGGSGSGATATPVFIAGSLSSINLTNAGTGYLPNDTLIVVVNGASSAVTFTNSSATIGWVANGLAAGDVVSFSNSGGALPTNFSANTPYFVIATGLGTNTIEVSATMGGSAIVAGSAGSGTQTGYVGEGATASVTIWPQPIPSPTTIAVFLGRVWLASGRLLSWTGTFGYSDVNPANAAGNTTLSDADLVYSITALRNLNNYLYIIGDSSVKIIGSITVTSGITTFQIVSLSSDQGTTWLQTVISYNRLVIFANNSGIFASLGSSVEKISTPMDGIFRNLDLSIIPSAATVDINGVHCLAVLVSYQDPVLNYARKLILINSERKWFVASLGQTQGLGPNAIVGVSTGSNLDVCFGSSGTDITPFFFDKNVAVPFMLQTALSDNGQPQVGKRVTRAAIANSVGVPGSVTFSTDTDNGSQSNQYSVSSVAQWLTASGLAVTWFTSGGSVASWGVPGFFYSPQQGYGSGVYIGSTITGAIAQISFNAIILEFTDAAALRSNNLGVIGLFAPTQGPPASNTFFINDGGVLVLNGPNTWPTAPPSAAGSVWNNGGAVCVVAGVTPDPLAQPIFFGTILASQLISIGGGNLPITQPAEGSLQLWNNGGVVCIA